MIYIKSGTEQWPIVWLAPKQVSTDLLPIFRYNGYFVGRFEINQPTRRLSESMPTLSKTQPWCHFCCLYFRQTGRGERRLIDISTNTPLASHSCVTPSKVQHPVFLNPALRGCQGMILVSTRPSVRLQKILYHRDNSLFT